MSASVANHVTDGLHGEVNGGDLVRTALELGLHELGVLDGLLVLDLVLEGRPEVRGDGPQLDLDGGQQRSGAPVESHDEVEAFRTSTSSRERTQAAVAYTSSTKAQFTRRPTMSLMPTASASSKVVPQDPLRAIFSIRLAGDLTRDV